MDATVFYAWESERPAKVTKTLIHDALTSACSRINDDDSNDWNLHVDSDTQGKAGMCDIPNTILEKITECDVFLADLSFVGESSDGQPMPNTNVGIELGWAAHCHGFEVMIGVVNEAFGSVTGQVFDIKRRESLRYTLDEAADKNKREKVRDKLSRDIEEVLRVTMPIVAQRKARNAETRDTAFRELQVENAKRVARGEFHDFAVSPATLITIQPAQPTHLEFNAVFDGVRARGLNPQTRGDAVFWIEGNPNDQRQVVELSTNGTLYHAYGGDYASFQSGYKFTMHSRFNEDDNIPCLIDLTVLQRNIVKHVHAMLRILHELEYQPPFQIGFSLVGMNGFGLMWGSEDAEVIFRDGELHYGPYQVGSFDPSDPHQTGTILRPMLNRLCREAGYPYNHCFTNTGEWNERLV